MPRKVLCLIFLAVFLFNLVQSDVRSLERTLSSGKKANSVLRSHQKAFTYDTENNKNTQDDTQDKSSNNFRKVLNTIPLTSIDINKSISDTSVIIQNKSPLSLLSFSFNTGITKNQSSFENHTIEHSSENTRFLPQFPNLFPFNLSNFKKESPSEDQSTKNLTDKKPFFPPLPNIFPINITNPFKQPFTQETNTNNVTNTSSKKPWFSSLSNVFPFNNNNPKQEPVKQTEIPNFLDNKFFLPVQTVSKFPPVIEFFVQKIQASQSNYIYEDLSRPPTYDQPVYTLSPSDQLLFNLSPGTTADNSVLSSNISVDSAEDSNLEFEETGSSTEKLFEIIKNSGNGINGLPSSTTADLNSDSSNVSSVVVNDGIARPDSSTVNVNKNTTEKNTTSTSTGVVEDQSTTIMSKPSRTTALPYLIESTKRPSNFHYGLPNVVYIKKISIKEDVLKDDRKVVDIIETISTESSNLNNLLSNESNNTTRVLNLIETSTKSSNGLYGLPNIVHLKRSQAKEETFSDVASKHSIKDEDLDDISPSVGMDLINPLKINNIGKNISNSVMKNIISVTKGSFDGIENDEETYDENTLESTTLNKDYDKIETNAADETFITTSMPKIINTETEKEEYITTNHGLLQDVDEGDKGKGKNNVSSLIDHDAHFKIVYGTHGFPNVVFLRKDGRRK